MRQGIKLNLTLHCDCKAGVIYITLIVTAVTSLEAQQLFGYFYSFAIVKSTLLHHLHLKCQIIMSFNFISRKRLDTVFKKGKFSFLFSNQHCKFCSSWIFNDINEHGGSAEHQLTRSYHTITNNIFNFIRILYPVAGGSCPVLMTTFRNRML